MLRLAVPEGLQDARAQLVRVQLARVDHEVGSLADRLEQLALVGDGLLHAPGGQRVAAPGAFVAADQHVVGRVEEDDPHPLAGGPQLVEHVGQVVEVLRTGIAAAAPDHQGDTLDARPGPVDHLDHLHDEPGRQVVDDEPTHVLEGGGRGGASGTRHPGHHDELAHRPPALRTPS